MLNEIFVNHLNFIAKVLLPSAVPFSLLPSSSTPSLLTASYTELPHHTKHHLFSHPPFSSSPPPPWSSPSPPHLITFPPHPLISLPPPPSPSLLPSPTPYQDDLSLSQTMNLISANDSYIASVEIAKPTEALIGAALSWLRTHSHLSKSCVGCASSAGDSMVTSSERELTLTGESSSK